MTQRGNLKLIRYVDSTYCDQYGVEHECYRLTDVVEVHATGASEPHEYYGQTYYDPVYESDDGRRFVFISPMDFGGGGEWIERRETDKVFWQSEHMYVSKPLVSRDGELLKRGKEVYGTISIGNYKEESCEFKL